MMRFRHWLVSEHGQDLVEYAMLLLLIAIAALVSVGLLGDTIIEMFREVAASYATI
jgi:Flp pilus assembly pilin Flp